MARKNLNAPQPIKNIAHNPPERETILSDGSVVREKLNPMHRNMKRKMLDKAGNTYWLSLANGFAVKQNENPYGPQVLQEKIAKGHLPLDECPLAAGYVEPAGKDKACSGKFTAEAPCEHIGRISARRQQDYQARQENYLKSFAGNQERMLKILEAKMKLEMAEVEGKGGIPT